MGAPDIAETAVCGLFCAACSLYIGSLEAPERLESFMRRTGKSREEATCHGCRSDVLAWHCRTCRLKACAEKKGIAFCAECADFPCADFRAFAAGDLADPLVAGKRPHRLELMPDCAAIKQKGWQAWAVEKRTDYACPACGTVSSAYDLRCRTCKREPASAFVERNRQAILDFLSRLTSPTAAGR